MYIIRNMFFNKYWMVNIYMVISDVAEQKKPDRTETSHTIPSHEVPEQTKEVLVGLMEA